MKKLKIAILMIAGPGVLLVEAVALFVHLFTSANAKPWIIGGLIVFFVVFIPLYAVEYFREEFKSDDKKGVIFRKKRTRTEWRGGNIHGKVPHEESRSNRFFDQ